MNRGASTEADRQFAQVVSQTLSTYRQGHADLMHSHMRPALRMRALQHKPERHAFRLDAPPQIGRFMNTTGG